MAKLETRVAMDMTTAGQLNFADLLKGRDATFNSKMIRLEYKKTHERDTFKGSFSADAASKTISGTGKTWTHSKRAKLEFEITKASISAKAVLAAAKTKVLRDDRAIIEKTFSGNDLIVGSHLDDKLLGFDGNDTIVGGSGTDRIDGGKGHDMVSFEGIARSVELALSGSNPSYAFIGGHKYDRIVNVEDIKGGKGDDHLVGDKTANYLSGARGDDTLEGRAGRDTLAGGAGNDSLVGGAGKDSLLGGIGYDTLLGGSGRDTLDGGQHADTLIGGSGNDLLLGGVGKGADFLDGGKGNDTLDGQGGNDTLIGGAGKDLLTGGSEADVFRFLAVTDSANGKANRDLITDFTHKLDKIDLSAIDAITSVAGGDDAFIRDVKGTAHTAVAEGHIGWYTVNKSGTADDRTYIRINNDADAAIDMTIELKGLVKLTTIDFIL